MHPLIGPRLENSTVAWLAYKLVSKLNLPYLIIFQLKKNPLLNCNVAKTYGSQNKNINLRGLQLYPCKRISTWMLCSQT